MEHNRLHKEDLANLLAEADHLPQEDKAEAINYLEVSNDLLRKSLADENFDEWVYPEIKSGNNESFISGICAFTISWKYSDSEIVELNEKIIARLKES